MRKRTRSSSLAVALGLLAGGTLAVATPSIAHDPVTSRGIPDAQTLGPHGGEPGNLERSNYSAVRLPPRVTWPLETGAITPVSSGWGYRSITVQTATAEGVTQPTVLEGMHHGVDFPAPVGAEVVSVATGIVQEAGDDGALGLRIRIRHRLNGETIDTLYAHLSRIDVESGQNITAGQTIGAVGDTGYSFGAHLHFEVWLADTRIDPHLWLMETINPNPSTP